MAPENSENENMVNLGIEQLQQLVQQTPSNYASTDRDDKSAMTATPDSKSSVEKMRYRARGRNKYKKGRRHRHRSKTPSMSPIRSPPRYCSKSCASKSGRRNPDKQDINLTNFTHCKEFGGYGFAHASPKSVPHKNAATTRNGRVGYRNGSVKRLALTARNMTIAMNDGVWTWTRSIARQNVQKKLEATK